MANESDDSNDEYYDAKDATDATSLSKWSSLEYVNRMDEKNLFAEEQSSHLRSTKKLSITKTPNSLSKESLALSSVDKRLGNNNRKCSYSVLIFVLHGGHLLESTGGNEFNNNKYSDFSLLKSTFEQTMRTSYSNLTGKLAFKLICCPPICKSSLQFLSKLSSTYQANGKFDYEAIPIDCLPLFATNLVDYQSQIDKTINSINQSFKEFIDSDDGCHFLNAPHHISFICDFLGGILAYDSLCNNRNGNESTLKYDFQLDDLFLFGCSLSLVLAYRKLTSNTSIEKPQCAQVYNLFHSIDRLVMRLEPLIEAKFSEISSISVPKYKKQILLQQIISISKHLKFNQNLFAIDEEAITSDELNRHFSNTSTDLVSGEDCVESNLQKSMYLNLLNFLFYFLTKSLH